MQTVRDGEQQRMAPFRVVMSDRAGLQPFYRRVVHRVGARAREAQHREPAGPGRERRNERGAVVTRVDGVPDRFDVGTRRHTELMEGSPPALLHDRLSPRRDAAFGHVVGGPAADRQVESVRLEGVDRRRGYAAAELLDERVDRDLTRIVGTRGAKYREAPHRFASRHTAAERVDGRDGADQEVVDRISCPHGADHISALTGKPVIAALLTVVAAHPTCAEKCSPARCTKSIDPLVP